VKAGLEESKAALLVIIGALQDGRKVVLATEAGQRESKESWARVLRDLFARGLKPWKVTVADGHLGIWSALGELCPEENQIRATTKMRRTTRIRRSRMSERTSRSSAGPRLDAEFQEIAQRPPRTDGLALQDRFATG
jgi:transposase-like protein